MKKTNELNSWLKIRSGKRTPLSVSCDYNPDKMIEIDGIDIAASELAFIIQHYLKTNLPVLVADYRETHPDGLRESENFR